jgi:histidyl-tRNA synthetase
VNAEAIGSDDPLVDAESVLMLHHLLGELAVPGVELRLGSLGSVAARGKYLEELKAYLRAHEGELSEDVRNRIEVNPLRAFDSEHEGTRAVMAEAPTMLDRLEGEDRDHFDEVKRLLDDAGVAYSLDAALVRGLDYYTRTIFEFTCDRLGAQSGVAGGGRYDGLVELLGGPPTPAIGWAAGIERILLALGEAEEAEQRDVFVAAAEDDQRARALALVIELRNAGLSAELDLARRSLKGQLKQADRIGAQKALILELGGQAQLRDMRTGEQRAIDPARAVEEISAA